MGQLSHALPDNKPHLQRIATIREWLRDMKNLSLLDRVTSLDTQCDIAQSPIETSYLRKLEELKFLKWVPYRNENISTYKQ